MQREFGSKALAELIVFTGRVQVEYLEEHTPQDEGVRLAEDAASLEERQQLRFKVIAARHRRKVGERLLKQVEDGARSQWSLTREQAELLQLAHTGALRREQNAATEAFGHGKLVNDHGEVLHIGGSTGGRTRRVMRTFIEPDLAAFHSTDT